MNREDIIKLSTDIDELTRAFRHELHMIPELALNEKETASFIRRVLDENGIPYKIVETGTIVDIIVNDSQFTALRADIDALMITENTGLDFTSRHLEKMHACGHDCNTAMLLSATIILWKNKDKLSKNIRIIFQPAEEACGGAQNMIKAGCLENVKEIFCLHMVAKRPVGKFVTKKGYIHASSDGFLIKLHGIAAHGASPQNGVDAILIAANVITSLQSLVSRETSPYDSAVLTIGKINGGKARNLICDEVVLDGTLRTLDNELRERLLLRIENLCKGVAMAHNGTADFELVQSYCPCRNDEQKTQDSIDTLKALYGEDCVEIMQKPSMGGEDFGFYEREVPGCKLYLGTGYDEDVHTSTFRVNEDTFKYGVGFFCAMAFK